MSTAYLKAIMEVYGKTFTGSFLVDLMSKLNLDLNDHLDLSKGSHILDEYMYVY